MRLAFIVKTMFPSTRPFLRAIAPYNQVEPAHDDDDPDRLFAALIPKIERMADQRVQPYDALPQGS